VLWTSYPPGLWLTAAIGVAVGLGWEAAAVLGTGLALVILAILPQVGSPAEVQERPREPSDTRRDDAVPSHNP
jgi:putative Mg2+ transporter-C (MgtC) family protein